jgi:hypothetical protein
MDLERFRASGRDVDCLVSAGIDDGNDDRDRPGRLYGDDGDGLVIERVGDRWMLTIANDSHFGDLATLEWELFEWARDEGYWED